MIPWINNTYQEVDFQAPIQSFSNVRTGKDLEMRQAARIAMSDAWALNDT
jgi:hypothetical protein